MAPRQGHDIPREHEMKKLSLYVDGMRCRRCVREVTGRLRDVAGVETVCANSGTSLVTVRGSMSLEEVLEAFAGTTYRPELRDNSERTAAGQS